MRIINLVLNDFTNDSRVLKTSQSLRRLGHDVQVVAMHNDGLAQEEVIDGVDVYRISLRSRRWSKNKIIQIIKLCEFIVRFINKFRTSEIIHCNDLNGLLVGVACKLTNIRIVLIYDSHEFAINDKPNQSKLSIVAIYLLEGVLIRFSKRIINVSNSIANEYSRLYGIKKPFLILNCPNYKEYKNHDLFRKKFNIGSDQKIFLYQGSLSRGRGIEILLDAFSTPATDNNVLVVMGYGPLEALVCEQARCSNKIFFHPAVNPIEVLNYTSSADYGVSLIEDVCLSYRYCLPNKVFEYLMAGIPVLASNLPEMRRMLTSEGVGVVALENSVQGFQNAVTELLGIPYSILQEKVFAARGKYCWEQQEKILQDVYFDL